MAENKPNKKLSEYDKYRIVRSNSKNVCLDFYHNRVKFYPKKKTINIVVDSWERDDYIDELIEADEREQAKKLGSSSNNISIVSSCAVLKSLYTEKKSRKKAICCESKVFFLKLAGIM